MAAALTRTKKVVNLTSKEFAACYSLNLRNEGLMRSSLLQASGRMRGASESKDNSVYATLKYNKNGTLAGWALTFYDEYNTRAAYFYVRKNQRRTGIGSGLVAHLNKKFGMVRVYPHDPTSNGFFTHVHNHNLNVDIKDDFW